MATQGKHDPLVERTPAAALAALRAGNRRFVAGTPHARTGGAASTGPAAVVFGCAEPQPTAETVFDRDELVVVRSAGHAVGPAVLGSIEYAVHVLGAPLVVVLGHDPCRVRHPGPAGRPRRSRQDRHPAVVRSPRGAALVTDAHVRRTVDLLLTRSATLTAAVIAGRCAVVGMTHRADGPVRLVSTGSLGTPRVPPARRANRLTGPLTR